MNPNIKRVTAYVLRILNYINGYHRILYYSLRNPKVLSRKPIRTVLYRQIYFTGFEALTKIILIGVLIGVVIITQVSNIIGQNPSLTGKILAWTVIRELGPLLASIIIIARSGTAIASELGAMKVNHEVDSLKVMGIDPRDYLIVPRVFGIAVSVFILTFYFQLSAIAGGLAVSSVFVNIPFLAHFTEIFGVLSFVEVAASLMKSLVFGFIISAVSCYHGLRVSSSITEIPQAATKAVMQSLFSVFIFDGLITLAAFL